MISYGTFQRGETVVLRLGVDVGSVDFVVGLPSAMVKPLRPGRYTVPPDWVLPVANMIVATCPADSDGPAGWTFTLLSNISASLTPGHYVTDVRALLGEGVWISEAARFVLIDGVTQ